jgi:hypothetical protein
MQQPANFKLPRPALTPTCPPEWLEHLRSWCDVELDSRGQRWLAGKTPLEPDRLFTRYETVPWTAYEKMLGLAAYRVSNWYRRKMNVDGVRPLVMSRAEYLALCPLLAGWHGYEPPTTEWQ